MEDAIARYLAASAANDIDELVETLAADVELFSPISWRAVFRGREDVRILLAAVYGSLTGLQWHREVGDGGVRAVIGQARVGPLNVADAMVFELAPDGRIQRIRPHLRPWLALTVFALMLAPKVGRHPALVWRALRRA